MEGQHFTTRILTVSIQSFKALQRLFTRGLCALVCPVALLSGCAPSLIGDIKNEQPRHNGAPPESDMGSGQGDSESIGKTGALPASTFESEEEGISESPMEGTGRDTSSASGSSGSEELHEEEDINESDEDHDEDHDEDSTSERCRGFDSPVARAKRCILLRRRARSGELSSRNREKLEKCCIPLFLRNSERDED